MPPNRQTNPLQKVGGINLTDRWDQIFNKKGSLFWSNWLAHLHLLSIQYPCLVYGTNIQNQFIKKGISSGFKAYPFSSCTLRSQTLWHLCFEFHLNIFWRPSIQWHSAVALVGQKANCRTGCLEDCSLNTPTSSSAAQPVLRICKEDACQHFQKGTRLKTTSPKRRWCCFLFKMFNHHTSSKTVVTKAIDPHVIDPHVIVSSTSLQTESSRRAWTILHPLPSE